MTNRPVNFNDPTGHMEDDGCRDYGCDFGTSSSTGSSSGYIPTLPSVSEDYCDTHPWACNGEPPDDNVDEILSSGDHHDDGMFPDCWHLSSCREEWANNVGVFATLLDTIATGFNGGYALVGDMVIAVCAVCEAGVLGIYRLYSFIPNSISTLAMTFWIGQGVLTGENNFTVSPTSQGTTVSLSVSQDTIVAVGTNIAGWLIPEPNIAFGLDTVVTGYDYGRSGVFSFLPTIPAWINPTITYNTNSGFEFSWQQ